MQLCYIHFYQKIARKKVARVNAALDAENQHTVLSTAEYGNSGNSKVGPNPCPQFRVNAATWPNVDTPVASESNPNAALSAYLERQGRNENRILILLPQ